MNTGNAVFFGSIACCGNHTGPEELAEWEFGEEKGGATNCPAWREGIESA